MKSTIWIGALLVCGGIFAGCAPSTPVDTSDAPGPVVSNQNGMNSAEMGNLVLSESVKVGAMAPDFTVTDENGKEWKLSDYKGKVVLLDFWGFWCPVCVDELPELQAINAEFKDRDFVMIGMNTDDDMEPTELKKKLGESPVDWRQAILPAQHELKKAYDVHAFPTKVLIDKDGTIVYIDNLIEKSEIEKYLTSTENKS